MSSTKQMSGGDRIGIAAVVGVLVVFAGMIQMVRSDGLDRLQAWAESTQRPSSYPDVLESARNAVRTMERGGTIVSRQCAPNVAFVKAAKWTGLPSDRYREIATRSLGVVCEAEGFDRSMTIRADDTNRVLARYHADAMLRNDRFELVP